MWWQLLHSMQTDSWTDMSDFIITFHSCLQIHLILVQLPFDFMVLYIF